MGISLFASQKGIQGYCIENQKGTIAIDFIQD